MTRRMRWTGVLGGLGAFAVVLLAAQWALAQSSAYVTDLVLVSSQRVTRYESDFTYRIRVTNQGPALAGAVAFVASRSPNTRILDNEVVLGSLATGATITSTDTFILRQDRRYPFSRVDLEWSIEAEPANTPPVAAAGPDQTVATGTTVTLDATGSTDADGDGLTYRWSLMSAPSGSSSALSSTTAARPTFRVDRGGTYLFRLVVNDGQVDSAPDEVGISTLNSAPTAAAGPDRTVARGSRVVLDGSGSADPDFDPLAFAWTIVAAPEGSTASLVNDTTVQPSITLDQPGSYTFRLTVSDGKLSSAPDEVTISTTNSAPMADAGDDLAAYVGDTVTLDGAASTDADGDALSFSWSWQSRPTGSAAALLSADLPQSSFTADLVGLYVAQLIVNDGFANSAPDTATVTVEVRPNEPPTARNDTATTLEDVAVQIPVLANDTDAESDPLTIVSAGPAANATLQVVGDQLLVTPAADFNGSVAFTYEISDGTNASSATVTVEVTPVNDPPVALPDTARTAAETAISISVLENDSDVDGTTLALQSVTTPLNGSAVAQGDAVVYTPEAGFSGEDGFEYTVSDEAGATATAAVTVMVDAAPASADLAVAKSVDSATPVTGTDVTFSVSVSNAGPSDATGVRVTDALPDGYAFVSATASTGSYDSATGSWQVGAVANGASAMLTIVATVLETGTYTNVATLAASTPADSNAANDTASVVVTPTPVVPVTVVVPDVTGQTQNAAVAALAASGLGIGTIAEQSSATVPAGTVISQSPIAGSVVELGSSVSLVVSSGPAAPPGLPPDPATVATPIDPTVETSLYESTRFLYTGSNPIQRNVAPGALDPARPAVLVGRVARASGSALEGVRVSVVGRPEWGETLTRTDGGFDLAVNAGQPVTVRFEREGFFESQRRVDLPASEYRGLEDVVLVAADPTVTPVDSGATVMQVARGSVVTDGDGTRQATLLFPAGFGAFIEMPDGTTQPLPRLSVRATEYTVGATGKRAMPAPLPPSVGYTYAVELSADEAIAAGARTVRFTRPVPVYVENFLGFRVGSAVPVGSYDRQRAQWIPEPDGRVIRVLGSSGGLADLDVDGDGSADVGTALVELGFTDEERVRLAGLYGAGTSLWRFQVTHLTPYDCNWPWPWSAPPPQYTITPRRPDEDLYTIECKSIVENENQTLGEAIPITGTPFSLNYRSNRVRGRLENYVLDIVLADSGFLPVLDPALQRVSGEIAVAGRSFPFVVVPQPGDRRLERRFVWDGLDRYGREMQGVQPVLVRVDYEYPANYREVGAVAEGRSFGQPSDVASAVRNREPFVVSVEVRSFIGSYFTDRVGLGAWTLSSHHYFAPEGNILYEGNGHRSRATTIASVIDVATREQVFGSYALRRAFGSDGSIYAPFDDPHVVLRFAPDGTDQVVAGTGASGFSGDGGPAVDAQLNFPVDVAVASDGTLYVSDAGNSRIRRVRPDGTIETVAGGGSGLVESVPATETGPISARTLGLGPDGSLYASVVAVENGVAAGDRRLVRIAPDGTLWFVGEPSSVDIVDFDVAPDGSIYVAESLNAGGADCYNAISRIAPDGEASLLAGRGASDCVNLEPMADGAAATSGDLSDVRGVAVGADSNVYFLADGRVRRVGSDGRIWTVAGSGYSDDFVGDGGPALLARFDARRIGVALDGAVFIARDWVEDFSDGSIRRISPALPALSGGRLAVPSVDGRQVFVFEADGRHVETRDALTGSRLLFFEYDAAGRLAAIEDVYQNRTLIDWDADGSAAAIVAPDGLRTELGFTSVGDARYLSRIVNPAGQEQTFGYEPGGLLTRMTDRLGNASTFGYDSMGRLERDTDAVGGVLSLTRTDSNDFASREMVIAASDPAGRTTTYRMIYPATQEDQRIAYTSFADGTVLTTQLDADGTTRSDAPSGARIETTRLPDPRFGLRGTASYRQRYSLLSGLVYDSSIAQEVRLGDAADPLSLEFLLETFTENGRTYTKEYDAATRELVFRTPEGRVVRSQLDAAGRTLQESYGTAFVPVRFAYDSRGRVDRVSQGDGGDQRFLDFDFSPEGWVAGITTALGQQVRFESNALGRAVRQFLPDGDVIEFTYDANGRVIGLRPPGSSEHRFAYDARGLLVRYEPPEVAGVASGPTVLRYDLRGALVGLDRPDGTTITMNFDEAGRLVSKQYPGGAVGYGFDPATGALAIITTTGGQQLTLTRDGPLLVSEQWSGAVSGSVQRTYDSRFRLVEQRVNGSPISMDYDADGLVVRAGDLNVARDSGAPAGGGTALPTGTSIGGVQDTIGYNPFREIAAYAASYGTDSLYSYELTYDLAGRIVRRVERVGTTSPAAENFVYDLRNRLTEVLRNGATAERYTYDSNGNVVAAVTADGADTATYDEQDRLLQSGSLQFQHNAAGEIVVRTDANTGAVTRYAHDPLGNLISVELPDGRTIDYVIDGKNRRVGKRVDGALVQGFLYQNDLAPVAEMDAAGGVVRRFVYATSRNVPDYMVTTSGTYRILTDHLGSPRVVVSVATGDVAQRLSYDAYGNVREDTNPGFQPFGFAGGLYDRDTRLTHFGAREYDARTMRFIRKDPTLFAGGATNLYAYAKGDPVNLIDPDGRGSISYGYDYTWLDRLGRGLPPNEPPYSGPPELAVDAEGNWVESGVDRENGGYYDRSCSNGSCTHTDGLGRQGNVDLSCGGGPCAPDAERNRAAADELKRGMQALSEAESLEPEAVSPSELLPDLVPIPIDPSRGDGGGTRKCSVNIWRDPAGNVIDVVPVPP